MIGAAALYATFFGGRAQWKAGTLIGATATAADHTTAIGTVVAGTAPWGTTNCDASVDWCTLLLLDESYFLCYSYIQLCACVCIRV